MCIVIVTTAHPTYPLILLNNRDEYLSRPTAPAEWWPTPHSHVLGGRDLQRPEKGTWLGITRQGKLACLTNFRESEDPATAASRRSRGAIVNAFLTAGAGEDVGSMEEAARQMLGEGLSGVGGFSLLFGRIGEFLDPALKDRAESGLAIISNRSESMGQVTWLRREKGQTHALSNSSYSDRSWPKVVSAEGLVEAAVKQSVAAGEDEDELFARLFDVLNTDTLPKQQHGEKWEVYLTQLRNSILIPRIGNEELGKDKTADQLRAGDATPEGKTVVNSSSGVYATQKQTIILVNKQGKVVFLERTLFDQTGQRVRKGDGDRRVEFEIES